MTPEQEMESRAMSYSTEFEEEAVPLTGLQIVDNLAFASYKIQRRLHPEIPPRELERSFGPPAKSYEIRYQDEQNARLEACLVEAQRRIAEHKAQAEQEFLKLTEMP